MALVEFDLSGLDFITSTKKSGTCCTFHRCRLANRISYLLHFLMFQQRACVAQTPDCFCSYPVSRTIALDRMFAAHIYWELAPSGPLELAPAECL